MVLKARGRGSCSQVTAGVIAIMAITMAMSTMVWWTTVSSGPFAPGLNYKVGFDISSGRTDLNLLWPDLSCFANVTVHMCIYDLYLQASCVIDPPALRQTLLWLMNFVPETAVLVQANLTVTLTDTNTNMTIGDFTFLISTNWFALNYTCQWTTIVDSGAVDNATMMERKTIMLTAPARRHWQVCMKAGQQLQFKGFFLPSHLYFCTFKMSTPNISLHQVINERHQQPLSATVLECPLPSDWYPPKVIDMIIISHIHMWDITCSVFHGPMVAKFNMSFTMAQTCDNIVPPPSEDWTQAIIGMGMALMGICLLGLAASLMVVIWHVYNQLVDGDELLERGKTHDVSLPLE
ncbi:uncharacterized protein ACA1_044380 [Acanthamoeba castellanii str. Neff]|uniref:Uncharacterized protein n=1 Tax=Acanthamoeba castellanii (strain ATCC 30010 / Neff) TaxID=1257118 RepID=L8GYU9_ACACF|nr:uncharacterized protein ACA1_044380 [Acanthamoeba castellanii str. Neff]ELR18459.1 hypothetical protein ACA1_044380 [Acanthamoeba castellanii str. Neff]